LPRLCAFCTTVTRARGDEGASADLRGLNGLNTATSATATIASPSVTPVAAPTQAPPHEAVAAAWAVTLPWNVPGAEVGATAEEGGSDGREAGEREGCVVEGLPVPSCATEGAAVPCSEKHSHRPARRARR
jgi:hypothetical protein